MFKKTFKIPISKILSILNHNFVLLAFFYKHNLDFLSLVLSDFIVFKHYVLFLYLDESNSLQGHSLQAGQVQLISVNLFTWQVHKVKLFEWKYYEDFFYQAWDINVIKIDVEEEILSISVTSPSGWTDEYNIYL